MARLIYSSICSLDGYVADENGNFDWAMPDEEVHRFANEGARRIGTYLFGRRMYDVMRYWASDEPLGTDQPEVIREYATIWQDADKVVYSGSLETVDTPRTTIQRTFEPDAIARLKASADRDISVGGPGLASAALRAGLVDQVQMILVPAVVGGGTPVLPAGIRVRLSLTDEHRFSGGFVALTYGVSGPLA